MGLTHALSDTVKECHPSLDRCHLTDTTFWLLQTCFRDNQAGQILMDLLNWWLDYNIGCKGLKPYLEAGFELRKPELFVSDLLSYAQQPFLDPDLAHPDDLAYFGSTCLEACMQHFAALAAPLGASEESSTPKVIILWEGQMLPIFAQCAGILCLLQLS